MELIERQTQYPGKRKLIKVDEYNQPIVGEPPILVNIVRDEGDVVAEGTPINVETLSKCNWRDDASVSFKKRSNDNLPAAKASKTQIITKDNGETWLIPPSGSNTAPKEIGGNVGSGTGTVVFCGSSGQTEIHFTSDPQAQITTAKNTADSAQSAAIVADNKATTAQNAAAAAQNAANAAQVDATTAKQMYGAVMNLIYPVGSVYISTLPTNPSSLFGGTWSSWGQGRVPVGVGSNGETNYLTAEQLGGSDNGIATHTHTQNGHTHTQNAHNHGQYAHDHGIYSGTSGASSCHGLGSVGVRTVGGPDYGGDGGLGYYWYTGRDSNKICETRTVLNYVSTATNNSTTATNNNTGTTGGNRMPFVTCYMWKRTA